MLFEPGFEVVVRAFVGCEIPNGLADAVFSVSLELVHAQGRRDARFRDRNGGLMDRLHSLHPGTASMEMESFTLLHLANATDSIRAATCAIVAANRLTGDVVDVDVFKATEKAAGRAVLEAITSLAP